MAVWELEEIATNHRYTVRNKPVVAILAVYTSSDNSPFAEGFEGCMGSTLTSFDPSRDSSDDEEHLHHFLSLGPSTLHKNLTAKPCQQVLDQLRDIIGFLYPTLFSTRNLRSHELFNDNPLHQ